MFKCNGVFFYFVEDLACFLKPWTFQVKPGEGILRMIGTIEETFAVEAVTGVAAAMREDDTDARRLPV